MVGRVHGVVVVWRNFLDAAQVDELVTMHVGAKTMRDVAEHFRVPRTTVVIHPPPTT